MKNAILVIVLAAFMTTAFAHRLVRLHDVSGEYALQLIEEGYDVANVDARRGFIDIMLPEEEIQRAGLLTPDYQVLPREWGELLPENAKGAGYYYDPEENWQFWCGLAAENGDLVDTPVTIGQSYESRDIYAIEMTSSVGGAKPAIIFSSLIHAREPGGNSVLIDFANWLVDNYDGGDTRAAYILDNATLYFIPIANPDGYQYNMPNGGMHRKNMNFTQGDGIDLNRNWGYMWGYDDIGSSPNPYDETYRGTSAFSEPETQVQSNFIIDKAPIAAMSYHTYGGDLLYPWGYADILTPDNDLFVSWAVQMTADNNYTYGTPWQVMYNSNGDQLDWSYSGQDVPKVYCMTPEVGDNGFWGSQNDSSEIVRICDECRPMNILFCMFALNYVGIGEHEGGIGIEPIVRLNSVHPNPVVSSAVFSVSSPASPVLEVVIYDTSGRIVDEFQAANPQGGSMEIAWTVPGEVPAGVYTAAVTDGSGSQDTGRFTVLR